MSFIFEILFNCYQQKYISILNDTIINLKTFSSSYIVNISIVMFVFYKNKSLKIPRKQN